MTITSVLKLGSKGDDVREWQNTLMSYQYDLSPYYADGQFGESTHNATVSWQRERGLPGTGIVDALTVSKIGSPPGPITNPFDDDLNIKFIQAKNYQKANRSEIKWIILHSMEAAESSTTALNVSNWFASKDAPLASAHFCIDDQQIIQCVKDEDVAYHAKSANRFGLGIEHAGYAKQTRDQWLDSFGIQMLKRSAKLTASLCKKWNIPIKYIERNGLKNGDNGISTHNECTFAFENGQGHTDPGSAFPMDLYINWVQQCYDELS